MPVTAKLSRNFYETFGDEIVNELVEWGLNQVDATYRSELRELNELNFARSDAKLEQRMAQLDAKLEQRLAQLDAKLGQRISELRNDMEKCFAGLRTALADQRAELVKWMFLFWAGTALTVIGLVVAFN